MAATPFDRQLARYSYNQAGVIAINTVLLDLDLGEMSDDSVLALHLSSLGTSGIITPQWSNTDNGTYVSGDGGSLVSVGSGVGGQTASAAGLYLMPKLARYLRLTLTTATTAGTTTLQLDTVGQSAYRNRILTGAVNVNTTPNGNPVRIGVVARTANASTQGTNTLADIAATTVGVPIVKPYSIPEADWQFAGAAGGIINTTDVVAKAAGATARNYVTGLQLRNASAVATEFVIKDGATVIWRGQLPANMVGSEDFSFATPLRGTAATALNLACLTTGAAVYANVQGYQAP